MRNVTKDNITEAFLGYLGQETDERLRFLLTKLVGAYP